ncbi:DNA-invertase from lambdoid prophage e14 [Ruegeria sp. TM1040]|uniref:recombinase family protein n=1 Tax=Ruegeria sp. (strain TM1040) TaxID=292414 RepID=UPI000046237E|nr:recombinase family protein [Ruegeria sp. TM1040]ABF64378.1 DNA-invertase from lambdoid prophage e14 [Ruegeria sp. TM1040]
MASESENQPTRKIGYARVSTADQNPDMQIHELKRYGVPEELIFVDRASGGTMKRPQFMRALRYAQYEGTELVVWKLDRLGRTLGGVLDTLKLLSDRGVTFVSLTERIDTTGPMGKAMIHLLAVFAELERDLIVERTKAGIERAKERGDVGGRPKAMTPERVAKAEEMLAAGERGNTVWKAMKELDGPTISRAAYYAWQKEWDAGHRAPDIVGE